MNNFRFLVNLLLIVITTGLVSGCNDEMIKVSSTSNPNPQIELIIPDIEEVVVYSDATERENVIESCYVVTFSSGAFKASEKIEVSRIFRNGQAIALLPMLDIDIDLGDRVYVICNIDTVGLNLNALTSESNINSVFRPEKDYYFGGEALPMSGSIVWSTTNYTITMTRAVAKVTVQLGETFTVGVPDYVGEQPHWGYWDIVNFDVSKVGFIIGNYGGASRILQDPNPNNLSDLHAQPTTPFFATTAEGRVIRFTQYAKKEREMSLYISEYPTSTCTSVTCSQPDDEWREHRQFLLMMPDIYEDPDEKYYRGGANNGNEFLAWRLDFYDVVNKKYLDIRRNYHYTFVINKIGSLPYGMRDDGHNRIDDFGTYLAAGNVHNAIANHGSNIEYDVYVTDSWAHKNYSNGQYGLSISADTISDLTVPFRLKLEIPTEYAGIPVGNNNLNPYTNVVHFYNNLGAPIGHAGSALVVTDNYTYPTPPVVPEYPINPSGTMEFYFANPNISLLENGGYMEIYYGNIYKRVPFKFYQRRISIDDDQKRYIVAGGKTVALGTADIFATNEMAQENLFKAVVYDTNGLPMNGEAVTWSLSGNLRPETTIDTNTGLLTVDLFEHSDQLLVTATSVSFPSVQTTTNVQLITWRTTDAASEHGQIVWFAATYFIPNWGTRLQNVSGTWGDVGTVKTANRFSLTMTKGVEFGDIFSIYTTRFTQPVFDPAYNSMYTLDFSFRDYLGELNVQPAWHPLLEYMNLYDFINGFFLPGNFQGLNPEDINTGIGGYNGYPGYEQAYAFRLHDNSGTWGFENEPISLNEVIAFWPCFGVDMSSYQTLRSLGRIPDPY